ncbi:ferrous iron transport protein B [Thiocapsa imhoffii]|uniref:Ferrous iron transport protein B n=1 Tax=Thiocapsa imhoffii TaxID=382777 RepID=A0A9X0WH11_9GAMM|nr:ferrous iron transport protein B [Thiocapsa imhoffii]MBK1644139.1 ferrous iron transport protein B [Thiocapsa imhoffii]
MTRPDDLLVVLAGQQNAGKSTLFNLLTGARQHVANYPGVTVDKQYGEYRDPSGRVRTVDLPGTYSLTSFSLEERVARDFLISESPDLVLNVVDASNLRRSLHLTLQLLEMRLPVVLALNMMDVAERLGAQIDQEQLGRLLGVAVVPTIGRKTEGRDRLRQVIRAQARAKQDAGREAEILVRYGDLEPEVVELAELIARSPGLESFPSRWLALKLLEGDEQAVKWIHTRLLTTDADALLERAALMRAAFEAAHGLDVTDQIVACRDRVIARFLERTLRETSDGSPTLTERIDRVILNRWSAPLFLILTVFLIYQISIVWGYELTTYTWPLLAAFREVIASLLPSAGFLVDPYVRALGLWLVDSANTLLNYVPIFLILFALIAILEDSGYMARIAFILDKVLHRFGLHGQSTLPLILGGVFAGGCAVPGVMATKGIPDHRARMATIFSVPFMNCLAKVPLYTLLLGIFFVEGKTLMMFYISTMTIIFALLVAKLLTVTVLRGQETAPFVMELPRYHAPTLGSVLRRAVDRTWIYVKKVGTIVLAVAVVVFTLLQFPGLTSERKAHFEQRGHAAVALFQDALAGNPYLAALQDATLTDLVNYYDDYRRAKLNAKSQAASQAVEARFQARNPEFHPFVTPPAGDQDARAASRALRALASTRTTLRRELREETIVHSVLGRIGRGLEPLTQFAGFDWKINVALLASFAARESSVATLGVLFQQDADTNASLEERMGAATRDAGATSLLAVSLILFFALYPPCLATTIMVKVQTNSYAWMLFSIAFPTALGLTVASAVHSVGLATGATGLQMMTAVYFSALALLILVGLLSGRSRPQAPEGLLARAASRG